MRRLIYWATLVSAVGAAYLMLRRGESLGTIAKNVVTNPLGSFATEFKKTL